MQITRTSVLTRIVHTRDIPVTHEQIEAWESGALIQDAFPNLTDDEREFILTGSTAEEWDEAFGEPDDEFDEEADSLAAALDRIHDFGVQHIS